LDGRRGRGLVSFILVHRIHRAWDLLVAICVVVAFQDSRFGQCGRPCFGRKAAAVDRLVGLAFVS
jgi:hypothetical protein